ncbi:MAG TPA: M14 metallopeptidase family protein [Bryobacteraceae bacterium]|nr:M14 metallopeptidase family protein [Bryobacteraceae bacterium]
MKSLWCAAAFYVCLGVALGQVPTPESVLGHKPGDDFFLASYDESLGYFQKLAQATDKLKLVKVGQTTRGLDWYIAIISSAKNLASLDKYIDTSRRLALVKGLTDAQAHDLARNGKVIVHIDCGLHATEVAPAQHAIQLAYNLVTAKDADTAAILDNDILLLWFSINPDGQNQVAAWYKSNLGTPYEVSNMPGLFQEYIGHDNNRDGYMNNMIESQVITKADLQYYPEVFYDHHQTAPFPARIWIPPFGDPVSLNPDPLMYRWVNVFGTAMAAYLDEHGMPGAMHRGRFDDWYPGFVDHVNNFRNTVSFLTETALYRYATPHFYTVEDFPRDKQDLHAEVFYSSPWRGGWWRLADAVRYNLGSSMSVLDTAAKNREELLYDRYRAGKDVVERFTKDPPYAYVIPREQRDKVTAALLVQKLIIDGIEVHQATKEFTANGATYHEGDWVVLMDQPFASLVKELFDIQKYPEIPHPPPVTAEGRGGAGGGGGGGGGRGAGGGGRGAAAAPAAAPAEAPTAAAAPAAAAGGGGGGGGRGGRGGGGGRGAGGGGGAAGGGGGGGGRGAAAQAAPAQTPYDVTGWTLPMQMGVEVVAVGEPVSEEIRGTLRKIDQVEPIRGKVDGSGPVFAFSHDSNASMEAVNDILAAGGTVTFAKSESTIYASGAVAAVLQKDGVDASSQKEAPAAWPVKKPRLGIYESWAGNIDEGWTRWILEQFHFPYTRLHNSDIQTGHLRDHYDTIIFAEAAARQIMDGMAAGTVPGQYAGGIGETGADALREFVTQGGTLVALGNASLFAIEQFNLPVTNAVAGLSSSQFFCSGSLLRVELQNPNHPVNAGLPEAPAIMFERNPVFDTRPNFRGRVLASYPRNRNPLLSGFLLGADRIEGKAAALDADYGQGHIILLGFRPQWRGQSHGTYKFLFNALYYSPAMAEASEEAGGGGGRGRGGRGGRGGGGGNAQQAAWRREAETVKTQLSALLDRNRAYFTARGPAAADQGKALETALDAFQRDRLPLLDDLRGQVEDANVARGDAAWSAQLLKLAVDLRTRDFSAERLDDLLDQYKLAVLP